MATQPGWISLLSAVRERFEAILSENITLTLYVSPDLANPVGTDMPSPLGERFQDQYLAGGTFPAGSIYNEYSSYSFFANPIAPSFEYRNLQVIYYNKTAGLSKDAWAILPADLRRTAVGANDETGWYVVVFRVLMASGVGVATWNSAMAKIEGDFAKASVIAIRLLEQKGIEAVISEAPNDIKSLMVWLEQRFRPFQDWLKDTNMRFPLPYVHEINDLFGPPRPGRENVLNYWIAHVQPDYIRYLIAHSHRVLAALGIAGFPDWQEEPLDQTWGERACEHVTTLVNIMRSQAEPTQQKKQKAKSKTPDKISDRQWDILRFLFAKNAISVESRQLTSEIADGVLGKDVGADNLKRPISDLKKLDLIDTKTGAGGGCWLNPKGIALASKKDSKR